MAHILRPARGYVLLEPLPPSLVQNGIYLPMGDDPLKQQYVVRAVGKGRVIRTKKKRTWLLKFPEVRVGDKCLANRYAGTPIEINGKPHRLVEHDSIMAILGLEASDPRMAPEPAAEPFGAS